MISCHKEKGKKKAEAKLGEMAEAMPGREVKPSPVQVVAR
jgi:hypothetical protein